MKYDAKADAETNIGNLESELQGLRDEVKVMNDEIAAMNTQTQRASEDREIENKDFQETVADQRAAQQILARALDRLAQFYNKKGAALVQLRSKKKQEPGSFATYKNNDQSGGVMAMVEGIVNESKALEQEALQAEQDAQSAYE